VVECQGLGADMGSDLDAGRASSADVLLILFASHCKLAKAPKKKKNEPKMKRLFRMGNRCLRPGAAKGSETARVGLFPSPFCLSSPSYRSDE